MASINREFFVITKKNKPDFVSLILIWPSLTILNQKCSTAHSEIYHNNIEQTVICRYLANFCR